MPRVHTAKAAKDYPAHGIKKGETYFYWANYRGPKQFSKTRPRASQLTTSESLSAAYSCSEDLNDAIESAKSPDDLTSALETAVSDADSALETFDDKISNLEEGWPNGCPALEEAQEQRDALDEWKEALDSAKSEIENLSPSDYTERSGVDDFDNLTEEEQEAMMDAARELIDPDLSF